MLASAPARDNSQYYDDKRVAVLQIATRLALFIIQGILAVKLRQCDETTEKREDGDPVLQNGILANIPLWMAVMSIHQHQEEPKINPDQLSLKF